MKPLGQVMFFTGVPLPGGPLAGQMVRILQTQFPQRNGFVSALWLEDSMIWAVHQGIKAGYPLANVTRLEPTGESSDEQDITARQIARVLAGQQPAELARAPYKVEVYEHPPPPRRLCKMCLKDISYKTSQTTVTCSRRCGQLMRARDRSERIQDVQDQRAEAAAKKPAKSTHEDEHEHEHEKLGAIAIEPTSIASGDDGMASGG